MKHLFSYSVYQKLEDLSTDLGELFSDMGCDGLELLTSHIPVNKIFKPYTVTVHLPYSTDWYSVWNGGSYDMPESFARYYTYGKDREGILKTIRNMIEYAAPLEPEHGVIHASNVDLRELRRKVYTHDSIKVLNSFAEMMNEAVSVMKGGEPPFKLVFENLWWPGLRMLDNSDLRLLEKKIEFENWGICLDTGHLMNTLPGITTQQEGIDALLRIFDGYSQDTKDAISAMHFHYSASGEYRNGFTETEYKGEPILEYINGSYHHINTLDQHLPFTDPRCKELIDIIQPDHVIHELTGHGHSPIDDFKQQRSLLD